MAHFTRFVAIEDKFQTSLFTFILPSSYLLNTEEELLTREFICKHIPFVLSFVKNGDQLNAFLLQRNISETLEVTLDFSLNLLCREHFTRNENFVEKQCKFNRTTTLHGRKSFTSINRLCSVDFMDERGNIQCELEIKNLACSYMYEVQIPSHAQSPYAHVMTKQPLDQKIETAHFYYSNYEWCCIIQPKLDSVGQLGYFRLYIQRLTPCDHSVKLTYKVKLVNGNFVWDANQERLSNGPQYQPLPSKTDNEVNYTDVNGMCRPYRIDRVRELLQTNGKFIIHIDLKDAVMSSIDFVLAVFPIIVDPFSQHPIPVPFIDKDKQAWTVEAYIEEQCFIIRLYYQDIFKIPTGYVRCICFNITVRNHDDTKITTSVFQKPVTKYYSQKDNDEGLEISTTLDVEELTHHGYLNEHNGVTIEIETFYTHLMFQPEYSPLDDIVRKHKLQIMRELLAAQNENYSLEKQMHNLQMTIQNPSRGLSSDMGNLASAGVGLSAPPTPNVVRKYYEMKYGDKGSTTNLSDQQSTIISSATSSAAIPSSLSNAVRNGIGPKGPNPVPPPMTVGARGSTFKFPTPRLPNSIQNTLQNTSQTIQSKLPASLQKLPQSLQNPTINMLASKFQNAFS
ncbi:unnamed protein product [Didymodactylos carnosus]|uniref:Uncharacterized protein n=1 Tax=Didymodactylos carnosus TaxID=1234261 RepID=A0A814JZ13_9BILA|nr:unnamed protein product [Didymodactylos carnosus]CAF3814080.1 unnamed protein product [Didymodactylos carnosus]